MRENLCNQNKCIIFATSLREGADLGSLLSWKENEVLQECLRMLCIEPPTNKTYLHP